MKQTHVLLSQQLLLPTRDGFDFIPAGSVWSGDDLQRVHARAIGQVDERDLLWESKIVHPTTNQQRFIYTHNQISFHTKERDVV